MAKLVSRRNKFFLSIGWSALLALTTMACKRGPEPTICLPQDERCNGIDDDCDGEIDEEVRFDVAQCDTGQDGVCAAGETACVDGEAVCQAMMAANDEVCDGIDNDCNGVIDDGDPGGGENCATGLAGLCGKGTIHCTEAKLSCVADVAPGERNEACNALDDDCDGHIDEELPQQVYFLDADADGYGSNTVYQAACAMPDGYVPLSGDCSDDEHQINPGVAEVCDDIDNNCNNLIDEGLKQTFFQDVDGDGYGSSASVEACSAPAAYAPQTGDCNDFNGSIHPMASETCNEIDDDCNGLLDDGLPQITSYLDFDGDGFASANATVRQGCSVLPGWVEEKDVDLDSQADWDCQDSDSSIYPGAPELCDAVKNDCLASVADIHCPSICPGNWPQELQGVGHGYPTAVQLDDDPQLEVIAQGNGQVAVWEHDGTLKWFNDAYSTAYSYPILAEMDGDNYLEVVVFAGSAIYVLDGQTGALEEQYTVSSTGYREGVAADLDGDGIVDLVAPTNGGGSRTGGTGTLNVVLRNGNYQEGVNDGIKELFAFSPPSDAYFIANVPAVYDMDGDGLSEVVVATGYSTCTDFSSCMGYMLVFDLATKGLKYPASTFVVPNPSTGYSSSPPHFADIDSDGEIELFLQMGGTGNGALSWNMDGSLATPTNSIGSRANLVPVKFDGTIETNGSLYDVGAMADVTHDGRYERIYNSGGLRVMAGGQLLDGYPTGGANDNSDVHINDINRDGRLDVLFVSKDSGLTCYSLGPSSYSFDRLLSHGHTDPLSAGRYRVGGYDSYEPNDARGLTFDPTAYTAENPGDPRIDAHAFEMRAMNVVYSTGSGLSRYLKSAIATKGDRDYYTLSGRSYIRAMVSLMDSSKLIDLELHIHAYDRLSEGAYEYLGTLSGTEGQNLPCRSAGRCFEGRPNMFILEVRGVDETVDYGPWPYKLDIFYGGAP